MIHLCTNINLHLIVKSEEAEINWLFPEDDEEEIEDKDFPYEDDEYEIMKL